MSYELEEVRGLVEYYRDLRPHNHDGIQNRLCDLKKAMRKVPMPLRECLVFRGMADMTLKEVAEKCDISESTAADRYYNALIWLTAVMNEEST